MGIWFKKEARRLTRRPMLHQLVLVLPKGHLQEFPQNLNQVGHQRVRRQQSS